MIAAAEWQCAQCSDNEAFRQGDVRCQRLVSRRRHACQLAPIDRFDITGAIIKSNMADSWEDEEKIVHKPTSLNVGAAAFSFNPSSTAFTPSFAAPPPPPPAAAPAAAAPEPSPVAPQQPVQPPPPPPPAAAAGNGDDDGAVVDDEPETAAAPPPPPREAEPIGPCSLIASLLFPWVRHIATLVTHA